MRTPNGSFGKRSWVKLWTNEWLDGTTRYQMSDAQRAFWIDLLAMAGRSRFPGIICAGRDGQNLDLRATEAGKSFCSVPKMEKEGTKPCFQI
jgi:hypothetical protein